MNRKYFSLILALVMLCLCFTGCDNTPAVDPSPETTGDTPAQTAEQPQATEAPAEPVTIRISGGWEDCRAIETVGREFTALYPNCTIEYEYLQDYYTSLEKRMAGEDAVDIFFTTNMQEGDPLIPFTLDLNACEELDLSSTFDGLIENFTFVENGARTDKLYVIPLGAEMRGLYINKTLLDSLNIAIPTDQASTLAACETLKQNGYIAFHGNPGDFSQTLLYPWICNIIANASDPKATYDLVNSRATGLSELFREPMAFLYTLVENGYYDYKRAQNEMNLFTETTDIAYARDFFNIQASGDTWAKADDIGRVAFLPSPMSVQGVMEKVRDDYHSEIEYVFVPAPIDPEGGFAYMSPAHGIAVNKDSVNLEWCIKFMNFLFQPENNKLFASEFNIIPNTEEAFDYISTLFDIPDNRISQLGQVTFDYDFYGAVTPGLLEESKANNPKYMQTAEDGTTSLYPFEYYMANLEAGLKGNE